MSPPRGSMPDAMTPVGSVADGKNTGSAPSTRAASRGCEAARETPMLNETPLAPKPLLIAILSLVIGVIVGMLVVFFRAAARPRAAADPSP